MSTKLNYLELKQHLEKKGPTQKFWVESNPFGYGERTLLEFGPDHQEGVTSITDSQQNIDGVNYAYSCSWYDTYEGTFELYENENTTPPIQKNSLPLKTSLEQAVENIVIEKINSVLDIIDINSQVKEVLKKIKSKTVKNNQIVELHINDIKVEGAIHKDFQKVLQLVATKEPLFIYGPAGSGKTSIAIKAAKALNLEYYSISVNEQTTKTDFLGYYDAHSKLIKTNFRQAYEDGGVFIIDEIDAGNPNVLTVLNSALSNGTMSFPDGNIDRNDKFICICTGNTTGDENNIQYIGRNILDAATLDRFIRLYIGYDEEMENLIISKKVQKIRDNIRKYCQANNYDTFISTRTLLQIDKLIKAGFKHREALILALKPNEDILKIAFSND